MSGRAALSSGPFVAPDRAGPAGAPGRRASIPPGGVRGRTRRLPSPRYPVGAYPPRPGASGTAGGLPRAARRISAISLKLPAFRLPCKQGSRQYAVIKGQAGFGFQPDILCVSSSRLAVRTPVRRSGLASFAATDPLRFWPSAFPKRVSRQSPWILPGGVQVEARLQVSPPFWAGNFMLRYILPPPAGQAEPASAARYAEGAATWKPRSAPFCPAPGGQSARPAAQRPQDQG